MDEAQFNHISNIEDASSIPNTKGFYRSGSVPVSNATIVGNTLISDDPNRQILEVDPAGNIVWRLQLDLPDSHDERIFDVEWLPNNNILVACACYAAGEIREFTRAGDVVWSWNHPTYLTMQPHDADRLENGNTLIADTHHSMVYEVDTAGILIWSWNASMYRNIIEPPAELGRGANWAHLNDIDRLETGNTLISLRNLDMIVEVNSTGDIVWSYGQPGNYSLLHHQHNPDRLPSGTTLIADSENNRIVEINTTTKEVVWMYTDSLNWPRDADRLSNGNTLITDSHNRRIIEVTPEKEIVWEWQSSSTSQRGIYDADRIEKGGPIISLPEMPMILGTSLIILIILCLYGSGRSGYYRILTKSIRRIDVE